MADEPYEDLNPGSQEYYDRCITGDEYLAAIPQESIEDGKSYLAYLLRRRLAGEIIPVRPMEIFRLHTSQIIDFEEMKNLIIGYPYTFNDQNGEDTWNEAYEYLQETECLFESDKNYTFADYVRYHVQLRYPYQDILFDTEKEQYGLPFDEPYHKYPYSPHETVFVDQIIHFETDETSPETINPEQLDPDQTKFHDE